MSEDEYYAAIAALGLTGTEFPETFRMRSVNGEPHSVPLARTLTSEQREATYERIRFWVEAQRISVQR